MRMIFAAALYIAAGTVGAQDSDRWVYVTTSSQGVIVSYDSSTVQKAHGAATAWVQYQNTDRKPAFGNAYIGRSLQRERFVCEQMTVAVLTYISYSDAGDVLTSGTYPTPLYNPVPPATVSEAVWQAVCG